MHHSHLQIEIKVIKVSETEKDTILIFANDTENMTVDAVQQMFERFYTGDRARSQGGTGLGLAVSRQLAEQMGGVMTVESRRGRDVHEGSSMSQKQDAEGTASENNDESGIWLVFKTVFKKKLP